MLLRRQYPRWGKDKLCRVLHKQGLSLSTSMVGRILTDLKRRGVLVEPARPALLTRQRCKLRHRPWATRKPRFWRVRQPGDLVALDTKQVRPARGVRFHHFSARDIVSRWDVVQAHPRADARSAAVFLQALLRRMPFPIRASGWRQRIRCRIRNGLSGVAVAAFGPAASLAQTQWPCRARQSNAQRGILRSRCALLEPARTQSSTPGLGAYL